jgi:hypothetical protein
MADVAEIAETAAMPMVLEGTWEEIAAQAEQLAGKRVRLEVFLEAAEEVLPSVPPRPEPTPEQKRMGILPAVGGVRPIEDFEAWMRSIPHFDGTDEEFEAFERAVADNSAMRRQVAQEKEY